MTCGYVDALYRQVVAAEDLDSNASEVRVATTKDGDGEIGGGDSVGGGGIDSFGHRAGRLIRPAQGHFARYDIGKSFYLETN